MKKYFIILIFFQSLISAQNTGKIQGKVIDKNLKDALPGVNIIIEGTYYGAATDYNGNFVIEKITPGKYTVKATLIGFKQMVFTGIEVLSNKSTLLNINMEETVLTMEQDVIVVGEKPLVDAEETQSVKSIGREEIEVAVLENIKDIVTQQAGVVQSDNAIHIRGGRSYENAFLLDGVSVQDPLAGTGFGLQLSANAIEEVEVITGGFNAEFGQATSGVINVKTREGGEKYSGSLSYKRDNFGNKTSLHVFNLDVAEANFSGPEPITTFLLPELGLQIPGKISFFTNFYMGISDGITQGYYKPTAAQLNSSIFYGTKFAPRAENNWFWLGKLTYAIAPTMKLDYSFNQSVSINQNSQSLQSNLEYVEPSP
ncbi:MAG: TonB-dependent receptor, partial [Melioribacteraceae bacterium]